VLELPLVDMAFATDAVQVCSGSRPSALPPPAVTKKRKESPTSSGQAATHSAERVRLASRTQA
jgi:hypothetical protein